jgi:O-antigen/teichoic acid export membrane protein
MYGKAILQGQQRYTAFNILRNATVTFNLVAVLLVLAIGQTNLVGFAVAFVVASILSAAVTVTVALRGRRSRAKPTVIIPSREVLGYGLRGYLVSLSPIGTFRLDQAMIGLFLAPKALGIYVVAIAFTNFPTFISRSVGLVAFPHVAGAGRAREDEMRRFLWFSIALSGAAALVLALASGWLVPFFFGQEFAEAIPLTRILLVGAFLDGARRVLTDTSSGLGRPGLGSIAEVSSWVVLVPALALLMPPWGITGVAAATAVAAAASLLTLGILIRHSDGRSARDGQSG